MLGIVMASAPQIFEDVNYLNRTMQPNKFEFLGKYLLFSYILR